jgi:YD repeat-containing protein
VTSSTYDDAGNLLMTTDARGATTVRTYDALGRALSATSSISGATTETVQWTYDDPTAGRFGLGRLTRMTDPAGATDYFYQRQGLLRREERTCGP